MNRNIIEQISSLKYLGTIINEQCDPKRKYDQESNNSKDFYEYKETFR